MNADETGKRAILVQPKHGGQPYTMTKVTGDRIPSGGPRPSNMPPKIPLHVLMVRVNIVLATQEVMTGQTYPPTEHDYLKACRALSIIQHLTRAGFGEKFNELRNLAFDIKIWLPQLREAYNAGKQRK